MELAKKYDKEVRDQIRRRVLLERRIDRDLEKTIDDYRSWYGAQRAEGEVPLTILAEGDSWFRYVIGNALIFQLERILDVQILNLAQPGDKACEMLTGKQHRRLAKVLKDGVIMDRKYEFLLFSGGGNDLVGKDTFHKWLHPYKKGMQPRDVINDRTLGHALNLLGVHYRELISLRDEFSPKTQLVFHAYDFAFPNGKKACWLGPWLKPGLELRKVPKEIRRDVVSIFLTRFHKFLRGLKKEFDRVIVVDTHNTVVTEKEWHNELHPKNPGFKKLAQLFANEILNNYAN